MRPAKFCWLALALAAVPLVGYPISHVGGGTVNSEYSLFESHVNPRGTEMFVREEGGAKVLRIRSKISDPLSPRVRQMMVTEFHDLFPSLVSLGREELTGELRRLGWEFRGNDGCMLKLVKRGPAGAVEHLATWGQGRGFVAAFAYDKVVFRQRAEFFRNLKLLPGACAWE